MSRLIPLLGEQAKESCFPLHCPVYIMSDEDANNRRSSELSPPQIVSRGAVIEVLLQLQHSLNTRNMTMLYRVEIAANKYMPQNQTDLFNQNSLRFCSGCPVYVTSTLETEFDDDDNERIQWRQGIILGMGDIPFDDDRKKYIGDNFFYSVKLLGGNNNHDYSGGGREEEAKEGYSEILHDVSPSRVKFRYNTKEIKLLEGEQGFNCNGSVEEDNNRQKEDNHPVHRIVCERSGDAPPNTIVFPTIKCESLISEFENHGNRDDVGDEEEVGKTSNGNGVPEFSSTPEIPNIKEEESQNLVQNHQHEAECNMASPTSPTNDKGDATPTPPKLQDNESSKIKPTDSSGGNVGANSIQSLSRPGQLQVVFQHGEDYTRKHESELVRKDQHRIELNHTFSQSQSQNHGRYHQQYSPKKGYSRSRYKSRSRSTSRDRRDQNRSRERTGTFLSFDHYESDCRKYRSFSRSRSRSCSRFRSWSFQRSHRRNSCESRDQHRSCERTGTFRSFDHYESGRRRYRSFSRSRSRSRSCSRSRSRSWSFQRSHRRNSRAERDWDRHSGREEDYRWSSTRLVAKTKKMKKTFRCAVCLRTFAKKAKLMKHRSSHSPQELLESGFDENTEGLTLPHQCCFCKNRFPSKNQLRLHKKSCAIRKSKLVKQQPQQVKCSACNVNVKVKNLRSHQLRCTKFIALSDANKNV